MKLFSIFLALLLGAFSLPQDSPPAPTISIAPAFTVSNRILTTTSPATFRSQVLNGKRLIGVNVTDSGCAPIDPVAAARLVKSYGVNWVRLHHIDRGLKEGWWTIPQVLAFMDAGHAEGIRFSIDGASKLGELYPGNFKADFYAGNDAALALYRENLDRITPLLKHPAMFMICHMNEGWAHATAIQAQTSYRRWYPVFKEINPVLLQTDGSDGWSYHEHPSPMALPASEQDVLTPHMYGGGEDFGPNGGGTWIGEGWTLWKLRLFVARSRELAGRKLPVLIQEFGSYSVNKNYGANEMFLQVMAALEGWSTCMFAFVTNQDGWIGKSVDKYAAVTDQLRLNMLLLGSYLSKNQAGLQLQHWDGTTGAWGPNFRVSGDKVLLTQDYARIGSYIFSWNPSQRWAWLVRPL
jgi:hypothetical protein